MTVLGIYLSAEVEQNLQPVTERRRQFGVAPLQEKADFSVKFGLKLNIFMSMPVECDSCKSV